MSVDFSVSVERVANLDWFPANMWRPLYCIVTIPSTSQQHCYFEEQPCLGVNKRRNKIPPRLFAPTIDPIHSLDQRESLHTPRPMTNNNVLLGKQLHASKQHYIQRYVGTFSYLPSFFNHHSYRLLERCFIRRMLLIIITCFFQKYITKSH